MPDFLLELYSEEIPASMQQRAADDLARLCVTAFAEQRLAHGPVAAYATPRRLVLHAEAMAERSAPRIEERRGPAPGAPQSAIEGFLRATGLPRDALVTVGEGRKARLVGRITHEGEPAAKCLAAILPPLLTSFPWPKSMRWGAGEPGRTDAP